MSTRNNFIVTLKENVSSSLSTWGTFKISTNWETWTNLETWIDDISAVFSNNNWTQIERFKLTATWGVATIVKRWFTQWPNATEDINLRKDWYDGAIITVTIFEDDTLDISTSWTWIQNINSNVKFTKILWLPTFSTTTERDSTITTPQNWYKCYIAWVWEQVYDRWVWTSPVSSWIPNASVTWAWLVQIWDQTAVDNWTDIWSTGAYNVVTPSTLNNKVFQTSSLINSWIIWEGKIWFTNTAPTNWLICDWSAISRTTYAWLFSIIGTIYGSWDGSTTFNIPNLKWKIPVWYNASETEFDTLWKTGWEKTHILTVNEIPQHTHSFNVNGIPNWWQYWITWNVGISNNIVGATFTTDWGNWWQLAHNNLQPYITMNYIIKVL